MQINKELLEEFEPHKFVQEASTLGLKPGVWPRTLEVVPSLGNGQPFFARNFLEGKVVYFQGNGCVTIHILND
jgi:hypothetical protein